MRLPALVESATARDPDWQLLVLAPVNTPYDFFSNTPAWCIPAILDDPELVRRPTELPPLPGEVEGGGAANATPLQLPPCWRRCPPTYHAFGWIYRRPAMQVLSRALHARSPPLDPLDIWVWEALALHGMLGKALCPPSPLVQGSAGGATSIKEKQDDPEYLRRLYTERGYGKNPAAVPQRK